MTNFDRVVGLMGASVVAIACASPAMAQTRTYSIPAQSAAGGVAALARQSDQQVLISARDAKGKKTREVRGEMTIEQAFAKLLAGSGLTAKRTGAGAWAVVQGGNGDAAPARTEASAAASDVVAVPSASAGTVVDARTGAALKGALVEIVETGEKTSTGDLGEFRFPGKTGSFNLRISYLGYPAYEQFVDLKDGRASTGILLSDGSAIGEIVVTAYLSSRAQALNQERSADNVSTVISDDLSGKFDGTTISDALRRAPGVTFTVDPETGDGTNVIIRGMAPAFNTITLNGLRLPVGDGVSRSPTLSNILADSVSKITINKTLLPNQDGSGTGGLVEIETKGPLDRPDRYFNIGIEGGTAARNFLNDRSISGTASMRFGASKNFGVSMSVQYRKRKVRRFGTGTDVSFGPYLPSSQDGRTITSTFDLDPRISFPFEPGATDYYQNQFSAEVSNNSVKNFAIGASLQWNIGDHTDLRIDYNRNSSSTDRFAKTLRLGFDTTYVLLPVDELNGDIRPSLVWEDAYAPGLNANIAQDYVIADGVKDNSTGLAFQGSSKFETWEFDYRAGYTEGRTYSPSFLMTIQPENFGVKQFTRDQLTADILANTVAGRVISPFPRSAGQSILFPGFNEAGYANLNDISGYGFSGASSQSSRGKNVRATAAFDAKRKFSSGILQYLEVGAFYERSTTKSDPSLSYTAFSSASPLTDLGLTFGEDALAPIGQQSNIRLLDSAVVREFYGSIRAGQNPLVVSETSDASFDENLDQTVENDFAAYLQTSLKIGKLEIVGGGRFERVKSRATNTYAPVIIDSDGSFDQAYFDANKDFRTLSGNHQTFLPRVTANLRLDDNVVMRLGYYKSIARPSLLDLNSSTSVTLVLLPFYGPQFSQPLLQLFQGNPDLKSATTNNFDISVEYYSESIGVVKLGAFYKPTKNSFMGATASTVNAVPEGIDLPDDPRFQTPDLFVQFTRPENSPDLQKLWGIELAVERQLKFLPGALSGLGVYANYTYTKSSRTQATGWPLAPGGLVYMKGLAYEQQSPHSGTAAITYSKDGFNGSLSYTYQSGHYTGFPVYGLQYGRSTIDTLDFKFDYGFNFLGSAAKVVFEGSNLLKGPEDPTISGSRRNRVTGDIVPISNSYLGGRTFRIGLSATF